MSQLVRYQLPELTSWTPFNRLSTLRDEIDRLFDLSFPGVGREAGLFSGWAPALDMSQDKDNFYVKVELPGMKKEEIEINFHEGNLSVGGERKLESESGEGETFRSERFFGKFHRSIAIPSAVNPSGIKASYKDGILTVTLPKAEEAKPKQIEVNVN